MESGSKATACTYFSSGSCQKGNECRFLHLPSSSATSYLSSLKERGIGVNKLKGATASIGGGLNSTSDAQVGIEKGGKSSSSSSSSTSCYFFSIGKCSKGSSCPFQHIIAESTSSADPRSSLTIDFGKDMTFSKEESRNKGNDSMDMIDEEEEDNNTDNQTNNKSIKKATPSSSRESSFSYAIAAPSSSSFGRSGTSGSFLNLPEKIIKPSRKSITTSTDSTVASQTATVAAPRLSKKFTSTTTKEEDTNVLGHQQHQSLLSTTSSLSPGTTTRSRKAEILMALSLPSVVTTKTSSSSSSSGVPNYKGKIAG